MKEAETKAYSRLPLSPGDCVRYLMAHRRQTLLAERRKLLDERGTMGRMCTKLLDNCRELALLRMIESTELADLERDLKDYPN